MASKKKDPATWYRMTQYAFGKRIDRVCSERDPIFDWFPSARETDDLIRDLSNETSFDFALWLTESNPDISLTDTQRESRKRLRKAILDTVDFID